MLNIVTIAQEKNAKKPKDILFVIKNILEPLLPRIQMSLMGIAHI